MNEFYHLNLLFLNYWNEIAGIFFKIISKIVIFIP